jgi:hypothetical protein
MDRSALADFTARFPYTETICGFEATAGGVDFVIPLNPNWKLFIDSMINPEYFRYLKSIVGQVEGTETYKVNCASCAMFSLGLLTTQEIGEETRVHQIRIAEARAKRIEEVQKATGVQRVPEDQLIGLGYGRSILEVFGKILWDTHSVQPAGGGPRVLREPARRWPVHAIKIKLANVVGGTQYRYNPFNPTHPEMVHIERRFIEALKYYIPSTQTVSGARVPLLAMGLPTGGAAGGGGGAAGGGPAAAAAAAHVGPVAALQVPHGTLLSYGSDTGGHFVAILNIEGILYLVDYQQQYIVPEPYILRTILRQSQYGEFGIFDRAGEKRYSGYNYLGLNAGSSQDDFLTALQARNFHIEIYVTDTSVAGNAPLFHQAPKLSRGIVNRLDLAKAISEAELNRQDMKSRFNKVIRDEVRTALIVEASKKGLLDRFADRQIASGKVPAPAAGAQKVFYPSLLSPKEKFQLLTAALREISLIPTSVAGRIVNDPKFHIEPIYAPPGIYQSALPELTRMAEFVTRSISDPAQKAAAIQATVAQNVASVEGSRAVALNGDLLILQERITDLASLALGDIFGVIPVPMAGGALAPKSGGPPAAGDSPETRAAKEGLRGTLQDPILQRNRAITRRIANRAAEEGAARAELGFFGARPFGGGTRKRD